MFKLVLFDLDGTLIDSLADIADAANNVLNARLFPEHPREDYRYFVGNGLQNLIRRIAPHGTSEAVRDQLAEEFKKDYQQRWNAKTSPYPGIPPMLKELAQQQVGLAILSNKPHDFTIRCVGEFFPATRFNRVYGQSADIPLKPDPFGALTIAKEFNFPAADCLFVGDTATDIETGKNAGMTAMGVTWGFRERSELQQAGADILIDNPEELIAYVERIR